MTLQDKEVYLNYHIESMCYVKEDKDYDGENRFLPTKYVKEAIKEIQDKVIIDAILWGRQWAEYVSDEDVIEKWKRKVALEIYKRRDKSDNYVYDSVKVVELKDIVGEGLINFYRGERPNGKDTTKELPISASATDEKLNEDKATSSIQNSEDKK